MGELGLEWKSRLFNYTSYLVTLLIYQINAVFFYHKI